jgi:thiol-disulfide isomerase/thioredoxin
MTQLRIFVSALALCLLSACGGEDQVSIAQYKGQWVFVNYWAEWCKPCIKEIPELNQLHIAHDNVTVLGVNFDGEIGEALREQEQTLGVEFPTLPYDPSAELGIERPKALPTTVIINPAGAVIDVLIGPQTEQSLLARTN